MICEPGDLVLIPFPFSDLAADKKRPVLILTFPDRYDDFIGLAVTSTPMHEAALPLDPVSMLQGSLPKPSWVRLDKIYTLDWGVQKRPPRSEFFAQDLGLVGSSPMPPIQYLGTLTGCSA